MAFGWKFNQEKHLICFNTITISHYTEKNKRTTECISFKQLPWHLFFPPSIYYNKLNNLLGKSSYYWIFLVRIEWTKSIKQTNINHYHLRLVEDLQSSGYIYLVNNYNASIPSRSRLHESWLAMWFHLNSSQKSNKYYTCRKYYVTMEKSKEPKN